MPQIAILFASYRADEPEGVRIELVRDREDEDLAVELKEIRKFCDEQYAAFRAAGGTPEQALLWMHWFLRDARRRREYRFDVPLSKQVVGVVDLMERLGALKRDIHNGLYVAFADPLLISE